MSLCGAVCPSHAPVLQCYAAHRDNSSWTSWHLSAGLCPCPLGLIALISLSWGTVLWEITISMWPSPPTPVAIHWGYKTDMSVSLVCGGGAEEGTCLVPGFCLLCLWTTLPNSGSQFTDRVFPVFMSYYRQFVPILPQELPYSTDCHQTPSLWSCRNLLSQWQLICICSFWLCFPKHVFLLFIFLL